MPNSSPPIRATVSSSRIVVEETLCDGSQQLVTHLVAVVVVHELEPVEVHEEQRQIRSAAP